MQRVHNMCEEKLDFIPFFSVCDTEYLELKIGRYFNFSAHYFKKRNFAHSKPCVKLHLRIFADFPSSKGFERMKI